MTMSLLSTARCNDGSSPVKTATPVTLVDSCYHKGYGSDNTPNVKDSVILSLGSALLFFGCHQEPQEGLYLHEAQELAKEMTKTTTWMGQPAHQQVFPITIVEGRQAISMSHTVSKCTEIISFQQRQYKGPMERHRS